MVVSDKYTGTATFSGGRVHSRAQQDRSQFTLAAPLSRRLLPFTLTASGTMGSGPFCAYTLDAEEGRSRPLEDSGQ